MSAEGDAAGWPRVKLAERASGLEMPVAIAGAGDGSGRLFVCERRGRVRVVRDGTLDERPFLDITDRVGMLHSEQGLLSVAFPPGFAEKGYLYVSYTDPDDDVVVSRFDVAADIADAGSEVRLLELWHPYRNHNGGQLAFGPDGMLYVGVGDGGSEYDPNGYGQNPGVGLGKILRIDTESGGGEECAYKVPEDNPFLYNDYFVAETWLWGLRNPWRFSFDRETGDMFIGEVGQDDWEEIDFAPAATGGLNFGWSLWEGTHIHPPDGPRAKHSIASLGEQDFTMPVAEYSHKDEGGTAVIGGYVYRGSKHPEWRGTYFFGDYGSGILYGLRRDGNGEWQRRQLAKTNMAITSFGEDDNGELYLAEYRGAIHLLDEE
jgi:glucose/arabinose dehydrogenase